MASITYVPLWIFFLFGNLLITATSGWGSSDKIKLTDVDVITLHQGKMTNSRRTDPVPQLQCVGGSAGCSAFTPRVVQCYNRGTDGYDVQWECKTDMDSQYRFGENAVKCEGYTYPYDPYVLKGSCGLEYTINLVDGRHDPHYSDHMERGHHGYHHNYYTRSSGSWFASIIMWAIIASIVYYIYKQWTGTKEKGKCCAAAFILFCLFVHLLVYVRFYVNVRRPIQTSELIPSSMNTSPDAINDSITLFVRVGARVAELRKRLYCIFIRPAVLFWPPCLGKTVLVFDEESELDHVFANIVTRQMKENFPDRHLEILFEPLANDPAVLEFPDSPKTPGYNRQLWSSFFIDFYTNDSIIAWMDSDAWFSTAVTKSTVFQGTKVRVLGTECSVHKRNWVPLWMRSTELALGLPYVADFMTYFPAYIYRDTFTNCREYLLKRFNTSNFEIAFKQFYSRGQYISPVVIILTYAWYFERDWYAWNLQVCTNLTLFNNRLPTNHIVGPEHLVDTLPIPQTAFHFPQMPNLSPYLQSSYCLSHEAAGNAWAKCSNYSASLTNNLALFVHDIVRLDMPVIPPQCSGTGVNRCFQILERHYRQVGSEMKQHTRKMDWSDLETVEKLANEVQIECPPIKYDL